MLSRAAERLYWLSRYMERCENTARLVNTYSTLLMDFPKSARVGWETVIAIAGNHEQFSKQYEQADERNVTRFMLAEKNNPSSLISSLRCARENARSSREIIPAEAWELINDLYIYAKNHVTKGVARGKRYDFLQRIITTSQQFTGLLSSCMSHNHTYDFVMLGRNIERADMSSRIIDVGAAVLYEQESDSTPPFINNLWMNVLRSLSAYQMYRQNVRVRINGEDVVRFLIQDEAFPRSILHCLLRLADAAKKLPNNESCLRTIAATLRHVQETKPALILATNDLYEYMDQLQLEIADIHNSISSTWFLPVDA